MSSHETGLSALTWNPIRETEPKVGDEHLLQVGLFVRPWHYQLVISSYHIVRKVTASPFTTIHNISAVTVNRQNIKVASGIPPPYTKLPTLD